MPARVKSAYSSGSRFIQQVTNLLTERNLAFVCDTPTNADGNCFCYAIAQQLHREEVKTTLSEEVQSLSKNEFH